MITFDAILKPEKISVFLDTFITKIINGLSRSNSAFINKELL